MLSLKVINMFAGPGAGKSTIAAGLFAAMKNAGHRVELVTEVAKDFTWGREWGKLENQLLLLGLQDERLRRLEGQVDWAITDSPLPTGLAYMGPEYAEWLTDAVWGAYDRYQNFDVLIRRCKPYARHGRSQTEQEAMDLDQKLADIWRCAYDQDGEYAASVRGDRFAPTAIYRWLFDNPEFEPEDA